jgi:UDP-glucose 4-epimerase
VRPIRWKSLPVGRACVPMPEYLVTGGCGFIGSHLCDGLLQQGHRVRVLDDLSTGRLTNLSKEAVFFRGDIRDIDAVSAAMTGCDGCFHLAAIASVERSVEAWVETHRVNLTGTLEVFEAARHAGRGGAPIPVVYASSAAVYGDQGDQAIRESLRPRPTSAYGADKLGCEYHARVATGVHGVPTIGLRFFNVYGPRQDPRSPYSGVISIFSERIARARPITIFGDGEQTRDFVYVADVVRALMLAQQMVSMEPHVVNVCTGRRTSVRNLAEEIAGSLGCRPLIEHRPGRHGEIRHSFGDPAAARRLLGFKAVTSLQDGIAETVRPFTAGDVYIAK